MIYLFIFLSKVLELTLGTLRLILVAKGKKVPGAILQVIISLLWILVITTIMNDILGDKMKMVVFILGSGCGSYLGSLLDEKLTLRKKIVRRLF